MLGCLRYPLLVLLVALPALGQVNTTCTTVGNTTNCNSVDVGAQQKASYEAGQRLGNALGSAINNISANRSFRHGFQKYCRLHPEQPWHYYRGGVLVSEGTCPSTEEMVIDVAAEWLDKHHDWHKTPENAQALVAYFEDHNLDATDRKSYDEAFRALKKTHSLK